MNCGHNNMTQLPDEMLPRTEHLIMTGNNLQNLNLPNNSSTLLGLRKLNLENNSIKHIHEGSFRALLLSGVSVSLSGNSLTQVPPLLANTNLTADIWLSQNPYECHCDMMWMRDWLQNVSHVMDKDQIKCGPGRYQGGQTLLRLSIHNIQIQISKDFQVFISNTIHFANSRNSNFQVEQKIDWMFEFSSMDWNHNWNCGGFDHFWHNCHQQKMGSCEIFLVYET